jgi:hypothetical protein
MRSFGRRDKGMCDMEDRGTCLCVALRMFVVMFVWGDQTATARRPYHFFLNDKSACNAPVHFNKQIYASTILEL